MEQTRIRLPVKCKGRDINGKEFLEKEVDVEIELISPHPNPGSISSLVHCKYGFHGGYCTASYKKDNSAGCCPYSFRIPELSENHAKALKTIEDIKNTVSV